MGNDEMRETSDISQYVEKHGFGLFSPRAVLFDMDGVLYDSMPNHAVSWHDAMADYGLDMPYEGAYRYEGMRGVETIRLLARRQWQRELSDDEAEQMYAHKSEAFVRCAAQSPAAAMPGIRTLMQQVKSDGLKICVVTGSGQHALLDKLLTDFEGLLDASLIVTAFDVRHGKPNPEPYLMGLKKAGVDATEAIVVENAPLGIQAARSAGIFTLAVNTGPLPDSVLFDAGANLVMPSMPYLTDHWEEIGSED